jgi:hypothetical protein
MYNNYNGSYNGQGNMGMGYNGQYQGPVMTNAVSQEEIKELRKAGSTSAIPQVTRAEMLAAKCTHRDPQKNCFATVPANEEGYVVCTICGAKFRPVEMTEQQATEVVNETIDIAQTAKMNFIDMSPTAVVEYFQMIPLLSRLPKLYAQSLNNFNKYDNGMQYQQNGNNNFFNMFSALTSPGMGMGYGQQPMYQQPMYGQQMGGQPMYGQQPMYQQPMCGQQAPQQNYFYQQQPNPLQAATTVMQQQGQVAPNQPVPPQQNAPAPQAGKPEVKNVINA